MSFEWYVELPTMFKLTVDALLAMIIIMAIISGIYYLPKKNRDMKSELLQIEREIAKKKVVISNQNEQYVNMVEKTSKEKEKQANKISELQTQVDELRETKQKLENELEKTKKKVGGRPKKTS